MQIDSQAQFYKDRFEKKRKQYDPFGKLPDYFEDMVRGEQAVSILEIASGPFNTIGSMWSDVMINVTLSDMNGDVYMEMWREHDLPCPFSVYQQNMENLTFSENTFNIVHCRNALDHTGDPLKAIEEMKRVASDYVYLAHALNQMDTFGGHHKWNIRHENGKCVFYGKEYSFILSDDWEISFDGELIHCKYAKI